jgi:phospholipid-binding lipoprotein MlaA
VAALLARPALRVAAAGLLAASLLGCATTGTPAGEVAGGGLSVAAKANPRDPWEGWNRNVFAFNEGLDNLVLRPVATAYRDFVPQFVRTGVNNVFNNFADAWGAVNSLLQGKPEAALTDVMRFAVNTSFGILGLLDIATEAGMEPSREDFGQTLGRWGLGAGPYLVLPLLGPSSLRDTAALPADVYASPTAVVDGETAEWGLRTLNIVNRRANLLGATRVLDDIALDKYTFVRDAYLARRRSLVFDGDPPEQPEEGNGEPAGATMR